MKNEELLKVAKLVVDPNTFYVLSVALNDWSAVLQNPELSPSADAPFLLFKDPWEVTLVLTDVQSSGLIDSDFEVKCEKGFRLLSFDIDLDFDVVGFMALLTKIAAGAGVSILSFASFKRDHLLVRQEDLGELLKAFRGHVREVC